MLYSITLYKHRAQNSRLLRVTSEPLSCEKGEKGEKGDKGDGFTSSGVTMSGEKDMKDNKITNLKTPTNNSDAASKKYVDDKEAKFKDDSTETSDVDLMRDKTNSVTNFYDDVEFKKKAKCKDLTILSSSNEIVNKNSLETGGMVGIQGLNPTVRGLLTQLGKTELVVIKGNPTTKTILKKHTSVNGNPTLTKNNDSFTLDISFGQNLPDGISNTYSICILT